MPENQGKLRGNTGNFQVSEGNNSIRAGLCRNCEVLFLFIKELLVFSEFMRYNNIKSKFGKS